MKREHRYAATIEWAGNTGAGYRGYSRSYDILAEGKPAIPGSSDPAFRGDPTRYNPEDLLVASLSACHMLWYLALCAQAGIAVIHYRDRAEGVMAEDAKGSGRFTRVVLRPEITLAAGSDMAKAKTLHHEAHVNCFIANSVDFPVEHEPVLKLEE